jgi:hypothetical protein
MLVLPNSSAALFHPDYNLAVHHTLEAAKVLRNMGCDAPAPIRFQYRWPGKFKPYAHQVVMAEFQTLHRRAFNLSEMGTMKTNAALWATDWMIDTGRVQKTLVLSPLSTLERVWQTDIFDTLMHRSCAIVHGTRAVREARLKADVDFYILNHDGIALDWLFQLIFTRPDINQVIVDEGSMFRNPNTRKFKRLKQLLSVTTSGCGG